jgi:hypothetical protein
MADNRLPQNWFRRRFMLIIQSSNLNSLQNKMMRKMPGYADYSVGTRKLFIDHALRSSHCADYAVGTRKLNRGKEMCAEGYSGVRAICFDAVCALRAPTAGEVRFRMSRVYGSWGASSCCSRMGPLNLGGAQSPSTSITSREAEPPRARCVVWSRERSCIRIALLCQALHSESRRRSWEKAITRAPKKRRSPRRRRPQRRSPRRPHRRPKSRERACRRPQISAHRRRVADDLWG